MKISYYSMNLLSAVCDDPRVIVLLYFVALLDGDLEKIQLYSFLLYHLRYRHHHRRRRLEYQ